MRTLVKGEGIIQDPRYSWAVIGVLVITGLLISRLWYVQIFRGDYYRRISELNRIKRIEIPAPRGIIYDRYGEIVLGNRPFFDLAYIPQYVTERDNTIKILSRLLHIPASVFEKKLIASVGWPKFLPVILKRNLTLHEVSTVESNKIFLPGVEVAVAPRRDYKPDSPAHLLGYLAEIDQNSLDRLNRENPDYTYLPGDLVGKIGLEARWENYLRGKRGHRLIQVDAFGRQSEQLPFGAQWNLPGTHAIPGANLELTIDQQLQKEVKKAFKSKYGAIVALDPNNGRVLAMVSEPGFEPTKFQEGLSGEQWRALTANPFFPFLDKTTGGQYPPGSIFKAVVAIAALEERIISPATKFHCPGTYKLGDQTFGCWQRNGHGEVRLADAVTKSCDVYFYHVGVELGVDKIAKYAKLLGLGEKLGLMLNKEEDGLVPTSFWKQLVHGLPWTPGDTPNLAIGQGFNLVTPMQMATLYSAIANGGYIWKPYLVGRVTNHVGEVLQEYAPKLIRRITEIKPETFALLRKLLQDVVMSPDGTGKNANVPGVTVAGKTGTAQVVSLKKSRIIKDVSMKWKDHAIFAAFSPTQKAEIAFAIVSENDAVSGGGGAAAPIARQIVEAYFNLKKERLKNVAGLEPKDRSEIQ